MASLPTYSLAYQGNKGEDAALWVIYEMDRQDKAGKDCAGGHGCTYSCGIACGVAQAG